LTLCFDALLGPLVAGLTAGCFDQVLPPRIEVQEAFSAVVAHRTGSFSQIPEAFQQVKVAAFSG
jgi:hypothetical protein